MDAKVSDISKKVTRADHIFQETKGAIFLAGQKMTKRYVLGLVIWSHTDLRPRHLSLGRGFGEFGLRPLKRDPHGPPNLFSKGQFKI
jgi:hypothetical protein